MALGMADVQERFENPAALLGDRLRGIYRLLAEEGGRMFPHDYFADCYKDSARGTPNGAGTGAGHGDDPPGP